MVVLGLRLRLRVLEMRFGIRAGLLKILTL